MGGMGAYAASKLAAAKLVDYAAVENPHVRFHTIHPGVLHSPMNHKSVEAGLELPYDEGMASFLSSPFFPPSSPLWPLWNSSTLHMLTKRLIEELATNFVVWITSPEAEFLRGKFAWSNWDVEELVANKEELLSSSKLSLGLLGWVEGVGA